MRRSMLNVAQISLQACKHKHEFLAQGHAMMLDQASEKSCCGSTVLRELIARTKVKVK